MDDIFRSTTEEEEEPQNEYQYFHTFVKTSGQLVSQLLPLNVMQLQTVILELIEILNTSPHDIDSKRFKCMDILTIIVGLSHELKDTDVLNVEIKESRLREPNFLLSTKMLKTLRDMTFNFTKHSIYFWDVTIYDKLIWNMKDMIQLICKISEFSNIHELMSMKIETYMNSHILNGRVHTLQLKEFMKETFERETIYPWKYYWNPESTAVNEFLSFLAPKQGEGKYMRELLKLVEGMIDYRLHVKKQSTSTLRKEMADLLNINSSDINLSDVKTVMWPLLAHFYTLSYEEIWNEKHQAAALIRRKVALHVNIPPPTYVTASTPSPRYVATVAPVSRFVFNPAYVSSPSSTLETPTSSPTMETTQQEEPRNSDFPDPPCLDLSVSRADTK